MVSRKIGFIPYDKVNVANAYAFRMRDILSRYGEVVPFEGTRTFLMRIIRGQARRYDLVVVNWTDNEFLDPLRYTVSVGSVLRILFRTLLMRLASKRTLFVRHNIYPHRTRPGEEARVQRWVDRYERLFDVVLIHSGAQAAPPRRYCPHPLYTVADAERPDTPFTRGLPERYVVVFGTMLPYKRIDELIRRFPDARNLVVIGAVGDAPDYVAQLQAMARTNVIVRPGFLSEEEAQAIVRGSDALLLTHAEANIVVSGSFFYAVSLGVPVVAVATPFLRWIEPRVGPGVLRVAEDIGDVCRIVGDEALPEPSAKEREAIQREFGDDAIRRVLEDALDY